MTAVCAPAGLDTDAFLKRLHARFGVKLADGQGPVKGKIFRIAHMGIIDELEILGTIAAMELVLVEMGQVVKLGAGVAAASEVLAAAQ
jgi:aspartate aminotransferase-like enzyme